MASNELPAIRIQNTGPAQSNIPFTLGHVFDAGHLAPTDGLDAKADGWTVPLQIDVKAAHEDGSVRHAVISGMLPTLKAGETALLTLQKAKSVSGLVPFPVDSITGSVVLKIGEETWMADMGGATASDWLSGLIAAEIQGYAPLKSRDGKEHPRLQVRFGLRWYAGTKTARVEAVVENTKTFIAAEKFNYDVDVNLNGKSVYSRKGMDHYHHSRWHVYAWTGDAPQINIQLDPDYLIATKAVPNYDKSFAPRESDLSKMNTGATGPMTIGPVTAYMPTTGGRADIGSLPNWSVMWLLSQDKRAFDVMMAAADGSGSWSIHYRDENTGKPVRTDNEKNKDISLHWNLRDRGPLPVPRFVSANPDAPSDSYTPYTEDTAHQPSLVYLPYLVTGDLYYLEELQFWAASNPLGTDPNNHGHGKGLLRWLQLRGQAWSMRTLGHVAYITPDADPMKSYFVEQLKNNIDFYTDAYLKGQPNKLGAYDGSGENAFNEVSGRNFSSWQDDFFTWAIGYLVELGFAQAEPLFKWKGQYSVARMTSPDMPWWLASTYGFKTRPNEQAPLYETIGDVYKATYGGDTIPNDDGQYRPAIRTGVKFIDMPQYSQEQMNVLGDINGYGWEAGRMVGYADAAMGYPANLNPTLAIVYDSGINNAAKAYDTFMGRSAKPDYHSAPQWAIVPRSLPNNWAPIVNTPTPAPTPAATVSPNLKLGIKPDGNGKWAKVAAEGEHVKAAKGAYVRYGANEKYVYAQVSGEFDASNAAFGNDPIVNVVKQVEIFTAAKAGKLKTPSNKILAKLKGLLVKVVDPKTLAVVTTFKDVTAASNGSLTVTDTNMTAKMVYAVSVEDGKGNVLDIMYPVTAS